jgi:hypothetical protein
VAFAVVVSLLVILYWSKKQTDWMVAQGTIEDTRIVPDHARETKWGSQLIWRAEYRVVYLVEGREFGVWADSGIRGESKSDVQMRLPQSRLTCDVRYDPKEPESASAHCS